MTLMSKLMKTSAENRKAWSLAFQFMSKNPSCIRAIPYENEDAKSLTMCLYIDKNGKRIPKKIYGAGKEMFTNYNVEFPDLLRPPSSKIFTPLPTTEKKKGKELADLTRTIEKNLHLFENRTNVTAVQASYKITDSIEKNIPCVKVYVLGKGEIPAGETDIRTIKEENSDIFDQVEFDVAEGYYKLTNGSSLEGHTRPLQSGVGIGVGRVPRAGTLGGFLEDEEGNVYILSNQHVLRPREAAKKVIAQPFEFANTYMREEARNNIWMWTDRIQKIPEEINRECRSFLVKKTAEKIERNKIVLSEIEQNPPRQIGTYVCGLERNVDIAGKKFYVDAAIATLDKSELHIMDFYKTHMEDQTSRCPLYGFETNKYWKTEDYKPPNGKIIDFTNIHNRLHNERSELRFVKIGQTTGFTDEGLLPPLFLRNFQPTRCSWAYNCLLIEKRTGSFSEEGDSGSLVFDQHGRAWGLVFAGFKENNFSYSVVSPLFAIVDALKKKSGKKELRLWRTPDD